MKDHYDPNNVLKKSAEDLDYDDDYVNCNEFIEYKEDDLFHIGQSYENKVADTVVCKNCGGTEFNVGKGEYYTAIRCIKCEWEVCIHDG